MSCVTVFKPVAPAWYFKMKETKFDNWKNKELWDWISLKDKEMRSFWKSLQRRYKKKLHEFFSGGFTWNKWIKSFAHARNAFANIILYSSGKTDRGCYSIRWYIQQEQPT